jgi:hypothetical protein
MEEAVKDRNGWSYLFCLFSRNTLGERE